VGIKSGFTVDHEVWKRYKVTSMETSYFYPTDEEITERAMDNKVKRVLDSGIMGSSVYMITGIKIARGFVAKSKDSKGHDVNTTADADLGLVTGVPIDIGGEVHSKSKELEQIDLKAGQDIVFAYQLREIVPKSGKDGMVAKSTEYLPKAAFLNHDTETAQEQDEGSFELKQHDVSRLDLLELYDEDDIALNINEGEEDGESSIYISV
jgi:hypothetical protein